MRLLKKLVEPGILANNREEWLAEYKADKGNDTKKFRYRHPDIKNSLKAETGDKCIYCECKIGHNTPGDIEHIIPSSKDENSHFDWNNLSIACGECNRRKNDYYIQGEEFLNPYSDKDIEKLIEHLGPIVNWKNGHIRAEITVKTLELNQFKRKELIMRKIEKIEEVNTTIERCLLEPNEMLVALIKKQLTEMIMTNSEFSGMVKSILEQKGIEV